MTVSELNGLPYVTLGLERIMRKLETANSYPLFFLPFDTEQAPEDPLTSVLRRELDNLMVEYRRVAAYIEGISDPWIKDVFVSRFINRKSFREIGTGHGIASETMKEEIYAYVRLNPEGYLSCKELAERWNLNINTINNYCRKGLLPGAKKRGRQRWMIPADATQPVCSRLYQRPAVPSGYITAKELAGVLGVTPGWISKRCKKGDYLGSIQIDRKTWIIPEKYAVE